MMFARVLSITSKSSVLRSTRTARALTAAACVCLFGAIGACQDEPPHLISFSKAKQSFDKVRTRLREHGPDAAAIEAEYLQNSLQNVCPDFPVDNAARGRLLGDTFQDVRDDKTRKNLFDPLEALVSYWALRVRLGDCVDKAKAEKLLLTYERLEPTGSGSALTAPWKVGDANPKHPTESFTLRSVRCLASNDTLALAGTEGRGLFVSRDGIKWDPANTYAKSENAFEPQNLRINAVTMNDRFALAAGSPDDGAPPQAGAGEFPLPQPPIYSAKLGHFPPIWKIDLNVEDADEVWAIAILGNDVFASTFDRILTCKNCPLLIENGGKGLYSPGPYKCSFLVLLAALQDRSVFAGATCYDRNKDRRVVFHSDSSPRSKWHEFRLGIVDADMPVTALAGQGASFLYAGTQSGAVYELPYDDKKKTFGSWTPLDTVKEKVTALAADKDGNVFAATWGKGVFWHDPGEGNWKPISSGLPDLGVLALTTFKNQLLVGTRSGIYYWPIPTGQQPGKKPQNPAGLAPTKPGGH